MVKENEMANRDILLQSSWLYRSDLIKADLRADIHFTSEPLLLILPPLWLFSFSSYFLRTRADAPLSDPRVRSIEYKDLVQSTPCVLPSSFTTAAAAAAVIAEAKLEKKSIVAFRKGNTRSWMKYLGHATC